MDGEAFNVDSQQIGAGGGEREPRIVPLVGNPRGAQIRYSNWSMDPATEWRKTIAHGVSRVKQL